MEEGARQHGIDGSEKQAEVADNIVEKFVVVYGNLRSAKRSGLGGRY